MTYFSPARDNRVACVIVVAAAATPCLCLALLALAWLAR